MTIEELKNISQIDTNLKSLSFENINKIEIIAPNSAFRGETNPYYISGKLLFDILFDYDVINNLSSNDNASKRESLSIILHELFHYKESLLFTGWGIRMMIGDSYESLILY